MNGHQQTAITTHSEGAALANPYLHATLEPVAVYPVPQESGTEDRKPKNPKLKTIAHWLHHFYRMLL